MRDQSFAQGATFGADGVCHFRLWAPAASVVQLQLVGDGGRVQAVEMTRGPRGMFTAAVPQLGPGQRYLYQLDHKPPRPDPASRRQPDGVHAASCLWDPARCVWTDAAWRGVSRGQLVIYELHVGTFTPEGTFDAIIPRLAALCELGVTAIELMPVGQFPGRRGWGYDGVYWFAAQESYGGPDGLQRLVDACHAAGLAVILDVVYNHLGPEGNYWSEFGPYFTGRYHTPWGQALNYDGNSSDAVRQLALSNVRYWLETFHFDGLRLDAVHSIFDQGPRHLLAEMQAEAHDVARRTGVPRHLIAETNLNDVRMLKPERLGGYGIDAQWCDDFHHALHALLTDERHGYYADFADPAPQLARALARTFVYEGEYCVSRDRRFGASVEHFTGDRFVISTQTHDQVGNRAAGERLSQLVDDRRLRLAAALLLTAPHLPMLFMGEEYGETRPFPFFCDFHDPRLQEAVRRGRRAEFAFSLREQVPDPLAAATFTSATLQWAWPAGSRAAGLRRLYADLLAWRQSAAVFQDFEHREAELVGEGPVLRLSRGCPAGDAGAFTAWFNLSGRPVPAPPGFLTDRAPDFCSESPQYGGAAVADQPRTELLPFECLCFVEEGTPS